MDKESLQTVIIPPLAEFLGIQPFESNQGNDVPEGPHIIFTATSPYIKDVGRPITYTVPGVDSLTRVMEDNHKVVLSFTAIAETGADAFKMALNVFDWFRFYGEDTLMNADIAVLNLTEVGNRDSINEDEARRGFDVTLRVSKALSKTVGYIETIAQPKWEGIKCPDLLV